jgi:hypothetical protein
MNTGELNPASVTYGIWHHTPFSIALHEVGGRMWALRCSVLPANLCLRSAECSFLGCVAAVKAVKGRMRLVVCSHIHLGQRPQVIACDALIQQRADLLIH